MPGTYCTHADVSSYLGRTFTASQDAEADALIAAASALIDRETRRGWQVPPVTGEQYQLLSPTIYLRWHPVTSIQQVRTRTTAIGDSPLTLIAGVDYELFDPSTGMLRFTSGYSGKNSYAFVDYTPNLGTVPGDISLAATVIVAASLMATLFPDRLGIAKAVVDRDVQMTFIDNGTGLSIPAEARSIIDGYRLPIIS